MANMRPRFERRGKANLGGKPEYISGSKDNPHAAGIKKRDSAYTDHGRGNHYGEESIKQEGGKNHRGTPGSTAH
jgi:hypothetical protein